jgi:hypothetical protein
VVVLIVIAVLGSPIMGNGGFGGYGWAPAGGLGFVLLILIFLLLLGRV